MLRPRLSDAPWRQEGVEAKDEVVVALEEIGDALDDARGVDAARTEGGGRGQGQLMNAGCSQPQPAQDGTEQRQA
jgi:hypothetical protein